MPRLNPQHVEKAIELVNRSPFFEMLSMKLCEVREGYAKAVLDVERKHLNVFGGVHGGTYAAMVDTATYWALYGELEEEAGYTTLDMTIDNLRAVSGGLLTMEGRVIKRGRNIALTEATVHDEQGRLLVHGQSKLFLSPTIQPMSAAIAAMGSDPLPPKFLED